MVVAVCVGVGSILWGRRYLISNSVLARCSLELLTNLECSDSVCDLRMGKGMEGNELNYVRQLRCSAKLLLSKAQNHPRPVSLSRRKLPQAAEVMTR
jgi:hypothetical protein